MQRQLRRLHLPHQQHELRSGRDVHHAGLRIECRLGLQFTRSLHVRDDKLFVRPGLRWRKMYDEDRNQ